MTKFCPTPQKQAFRNMTTARNFSIMVTVHTIRKRKSPTARYGYRCRCGRVHITRKPTWDGRSHVLLARVRPILTLMEEAYQAGSRDTVARLLGSP